MLTGAYLYLFHRLSGKIDTKRMFHDPLNTYAYGTDASLYRLTPRLVVRVKDELEVSFLLKEAGKAGIPVTFRAAGTSLSGQAVSDSVLVIAGSDWNEYEILEDGKIIRLQPGLIGSKVNKLLAPYRRQIGPDPASISSAMIGGIVANNASGMCCGTINNSYQSLAGMRIIFYDGTILDTRDEESRKQFSHTHPEFILNLKNLSESVKTNTHLAQLIEKKFRIKNTTGYSLNALINYSDPVDIIEHLMVGSEGTLGFISEVTFRTFETLPFKASAIIVFPDLEDACNAVIKLKETNASTAELIDRSGLRSVADDPGMPGWISRLSDGSTALLVETHAKDKESLKSNITKIEEVLASIPVEIPARFTELEEEYSQYWKIRQGLFPKVGAMRETGTSVIIEDIAVPVDRLAEVTLDLQDLLKKFEYKDAVIYGHALEGNLHFVFSQDFSKQEEILRYEHFMQDIACLIVQKYDGSLKAEHGTGRNVAPFVKFEWGEEAYEVMKQVKHIFDPDNLLNPGVVLNEDENVHLKNLKLTPAAHEKIDKCIECGFCEPACVSHGMTLSPRQRITVFREISRLKSSGEEPHRLAALINKFDYSADKTCATDGLCSLSCPVSIDTGLLIKELRLLNITKKQSGRAMWIAFHMSLVTSLARKGLSFISTFHYLFGSRLMKAISGFVRKISGNRIPKWTVAMPSGAVKIKTNTVLTDNPRKVVYFPSCINRSMGVSKDYDEKIQLTEKTKGLIIKAGYEIIYPENSNNLCCGMAFSSKGYKEAGLLKSKELEKALRTSGNNGEIPILCDMSPCLYTMKENMEPGLKLYEPVEFILKYLVPEFDITPLNETIMVFPVCSMKKMGLEGKLIELAKMCAKGVFVPETNCCGFAGDRGFSFPELNEHGLKSLKNLIPENITRGYSNSRTCEIGLTTHAGISFKSIVYLVDEVSVNKLSLEPK